MGSYCLMGIGFQFYKMKRAMEMMVMMYHRTGHLKVVKMVNFMCILITMFLIVGKNVIIQVHANQRAKNLKGDKTRYW